MKWNFGKHRRSVITSFYTTTESLIASSDCILAISTAVFFGPQGALDDKTQYQWTDLASYINIRRKK